jgi:hypothetical protein
VDKRSHCSCVLFAQPQVAFIWLSDPVNCVVNDVKLAAAAARAEKDAALEDSLASMKRSLLKREVKAVLAAMHVKNAAREAALNPRAAQNAANILRVQNETLICFMHAFDVLKPSAVARLCDGKSTHLEQRSIKSQRTSHDDSSVHSENSSHSGDERKETDGASAGAGNIYAPPRDAL